MDLRKGANGRFYSCPNFPRCDYAVSCHPESTAPMGIPADRETRRWRTMAHKFFDRTWRGDSACMTRKAAYRALQTGLGLTEDQAHIAMFDIAQCKALIKLLLGDGFQESKISLKALKNVLDRKRVRA